MVYFIFKDQLFFRKKREKLHKSVQRVFAMISYVHCGYQNVKCYSTRSILPKPLFVLFLKQYGTPEPEGKSETMMSSQFLHQSSHVIVHSDISVELITKSRVFAVAGLRPNDSPK